jgi:hypothetical protein
VIAHLTEQMGRYRQPSRNGTEYGAAEGRFAFIAEARDVRPPSDDGIQAMAGFW